MKRDIRCGLPSASEYHRIKACPGSGRMCRGLPDVPDEKMAGYGERGDRIHAWLAGKRVKLNDEELGIAKACERQREALLLRTFGGEQYSAYKEKRLWLLDGKRKAFSGQADFFAFSYTTAVIVDYKSGFSVQEDSPHNLQLRSLAVLLDNACRLSTVKTDYKLTEVVVAIIQPPKTSEPLTCSYGREELDQAKAELIQDLAAYNKLDAPLRPGDHCNLCRARLLCPARQDCAGAVITLRESPGWAIAPKDLPALIPRAKLAKRYAEDILKFAKLMLKEGNQIPGWKLSDGNDVREVTDALGAYTSLCAAGTLTKDEFLECISVSIGAVVDKVYDRRNPHRKKKGPTKREIEAEVGRLLEPFITKVKRDSTLERSDDATAVS